MGVGKDHAPIWERSVSNRYMPNRGLLTDHDREFFRGNLDDETETDRMRKKRHNIRQRIDRIAEDIEILRDAGHDELVGEFHATVSQYGRLERRVRELEDRLDVADRPAETDSKDV